MSIKDELELSSKFMPAYKAHHFIHSYEFINVSSLDLTASEYECPLKPTIRSIRQWHLELNFWVFLR